MKLVSFMIYLCVSGVWKTRNVCFLFECHKSTNLPEKKKKTSVESPKNVPPRLEVTLWDTQFLLTKKGIYAWRIIPINKWLVTPIYKPFRPFEKGNNPI